MSAKVSRALEDVGMVPQSGHFTWKEDGNKKGYLEFVSNNPNDKLEKRRRAKEGNKRSDRISSSVAKTKNWEKRAVNKPKSPRTAIKQTEAHSTVTLDDIKSVARDMLEIEGVSETFKGMCDTPQFDTFLKYLLCYFHCFFEKLHQEHKQNISTYIEPSLSEKKAYADSLVKLQVAERYLGQAYCVLVLGLGLEKQHHMACGISRVSSTYKDRGMFETLYSFCTFVVWITFRRKEFETVRKEVGRMLRSDTFNPAIRVKNAPEEKDSEHKKEEKQTAEKKDVKGVEKVTPAEYRRLHPHSNPPSTFPLKLIQPVFMSKRPAIKSIINQRSPAVVAILPSPKEEAHWLFRRTGALSPSSLAKMGLADSDDDDTEDHHGPFANLMSDRKPFKIGILGEPLGQYNAKTLSPQGAENEDEENKGEDGEQKQGESGTEKTPQPERDTSRQQTSLSVAATDA